MLTDEVDAGITNWIQGDVALDPGIDFVHVADLARPISQASRRLKEANPNETGIVSVNEGVAGLVIVTQSCDIVRASETRSLIQVAPLVQVSAVTLREIQILKRPQYAFVPGVAGRCLVADLDRTMTIEKSFLIGWVRIPGCVTDADQRAFANALARNKSRFAFPDKFVAIAGRLAARIRQKFKTNGPEGQHINALEEIRVRAAPSWTAEKVQLTWWFIKRADPASGEGQWQVHVDKWLGMVNDNTGQYRSDPPVVCFLEHMNARDYVESDRFDFDDLSRAAG